MGVAWTFASHWMFVRTQVWADTFEPVLALVMTLIVATAYETGRVRRVFHRFMPSGVAESMLESHPDDAAYAQEREATVVFCDVRNSTRLAEVLPSRTVEELMRQYFTAGEEAAHRLGTELDKFVGDEIMLYFEDRRGLEPHAVRAIRWAFALQEACGRITDSGLAGDIGFRAGVGMCTGVVRIGTVGARRRIQHTVMGDAVNTAARIQALTKELNEPILFGETTWDNVKTFVEGAPIGEVPIRGKEHPMKLYKPVRMR
jgi:adenylate cyclase